jgi:hypothetical protein
MATMMDLIARTRIELGDTGEPFHSYFLSDGGTTDYDLPATNVSLFGLDAYTVTQPVAAIPATNTTPLVPAVPSVQRSLVNGTDYVLDQENGMLSLLAPIAEGITIGVNGLRYGMFSDQELALYVQDALDQHTQGRYITERFRTTQGFISYADAAMTVVNLPDIEFTPVALLATISALWALATDASTDIDITSPEGVTINRGQRFAQIRAQIDFLTDRYKTLCNLLEIGLYRIEMSTLRRVSRLNGRLVPVFKDREYDDYRLPQRELPPIDNRHPDESGIPSPLWSAYGGV